jgi:hypothetical protein
MSVQFSCRLFRNSSFLYIYVLSLAIFFVSAQANANSIVNACMNKPATFTEHSVSTNIKNVELKLLDSRKWKIQGFKILIENSSSIRPKHKKKRFDAIFSYEDSFRTCKLKARVRQSGDWRDHIQYVGLDIRRSIDVRLKEGNFLGATKFKLLLPETRNSKNHVLGGNIFASMGFLSPKPRMMNITIDGIEREMLFEEKVTKEFVEARKLREGAIFEGDESYIWSFNNYKPFKLEPISLSRLVNDKWAVRSKTNLITSLQGLERLQRAFAKMRLVGNLNTFIDWELVNSNTRLYDRSPILFDLFLIASGASHGLRPTNRKFYLDPFTMNILPIVYDGNVDFTCCEGGTTLLTLSDIDNYSRIFLSSDFNILRGKLLEISAGDLLNAVNENAPPKALWQKQEIQRVLEKIYDNLNRLELLLIETKKRSIELSASFNTIPSSKLLKSFILQADKALPNAKYEIYEEINFEKQEVTVQSCGINDCVTLQNNIAEVSKTLTMNLDRKNIRSYPGLMKFLPPKFSVTQIPAIGIQVFHSESSEVFFSHSLRTLTLKQREISDQFLILNSQLEGIKVIFAGMDISSDKHLTAIERQQLAKTQSNQKFTGCVTFYQVKFDNVDFSGTGGLCEDQLNLVRSEGDIGKVLVINAFSDGVDIDFSNLEIQKVTVSGANNDCIDVSGGLYFFEELIVENCSDKALSVGEMSALEALNMEVQKSNIAIAVKDSSAAKIEKLSAKNVNVCGSVYNKKQEFFGGLMKLNRVDCPSGNYFKDNVSWLFKN